MAVRLFSHTKARIAEEAGACAVMALERVPADIRATGGVARMASGRLSFVRVVLVPLLFPFAE
jgi:pyridoxal 5'-phosphate synthase pdxS subunit